MDFEAIRAALTEGVDEDVARIQRMIRQPSVSAEGQGIRECADLVRRELKSLGAEDAHLVETDGHPVVFGHVNAEAGRTVLVYLMYDTQPVEGEAWTWPPFEARVVPMEPFGRVVVGRGAINTKGPMVAFFNGIRAVRATGQDLPVNLIVVAEGEEELGSPHLGDFVRDHLDSLQEAEAVFYPAASQDREGRAKLFLGNKGIVYFEVECTGARWGRGPTAFDIHSSHKAWIDSPAWRLIHALATMTSPDGNDIRIDGLADEVAPPTGEDLELMRDLAKTFREETVLEQNEVERFVDDLHGEDLLRRYLFGTTLNVDGIWGGYTGPGTKTVLPWRVRAKLDVRLVPNQRAADVVPAVRRHLDAHGFGDIAVVAHDAYDWSKTPRDAAIVQAAIAMYRESGCPYEVWPMIGGSLPMCLFTQEPLKLPAVYAGLGHGARAHAPDEYMVVDGNERVRGLVDQELSYLHVLDRFAKLA